MDYKDLSNLLDDTINHLMSFSDVDEEILLRFKEYVLSQYDNNY